MNTFLRLCLLPLLLVVTTDADAASASAREEAGGAVFELRFDADVTVRRRERGGGVVLSFSRPLETELEPAAQALSAWVAALWGGYDSLLIKPRDGVDLVVTIEPRGVRVELHRVDLPGAAPTAQAEAPPAAAPSPRQQLRLARLDALWLVEKGRLTEAGLALRGLLEVHPDDAGLYTDLANVEARLGRWRQALEHYDAALRLMRGDDTEADAVEVARARAELWHEVGPYFKVEAWHQRYGSSETQDGVDSTLRWLPDSAGEWAVEIDLRAIELREKTAVRRLDGFSGSFAGQRQRLYADVIYTTEALGHGRVGLSFNGRVAGLRWRHESQPAAGASHWVSAVLHEAWNELPEALIGYGYRDGIAGGYRFSPLERVSAEAGVGLNRYGLDGFDDAAKSWDANLALRYRVAGPNPYVDVGYGLDKRRAYDVVARVAPDTTVFQPLPLSSNEVHSVDLSYLERVGAVLSLRGQIGYGYDRHNAHGPFANAGLVYRPAIDFEGGLLATYNSTSGRAGDGVLSRYNAYLQWWF